MTLDHLRQAASSRGISQDLAGAVLDNDWFQTGTLLQEADAQAGRTLRYTEVRLLLEVAGQRMCPTRERVRQCRSVCGHFVASGLNRQQARGVPLETARVLCQHHRKGRMTTREFVRTVAHVQKARPRAAAVRTPEGLRSVLATA